MDQIAPPRRTIDLAITGMTCASCVTRVEKTLGRVAGVQTVAVNLATETAHVTTGADTALPALIAAVETAGYHAQARADVRPAAGHREILELAAAAILTAPLLLGMVLTLPGWLALALATPVQFWLGARFYSAGWAALRAGTGTMDLLVALGTSAAYFLSFVDFLSTGPLYFESSAAVITLIRLGKYLEGRAKRDAARAITGLATLRPATAHIPGRGDIPLAALRPGDIVEIRPGERVPVDGAIVGGAGSLDQSHITGESLPVFREPGGTVMAGSLNLDGVLRVSATATAGETLLDRMGRLIDAAQSSKPAIQRLADRVAAIFVPVVLVIAAATLAGWLLAGAHAATAIINAVSVLVIACPCALGLATPAAILAGTGIAARHGILIRNADALQRAARVDFVVFDKTGTLTLGQPELVNVEVFGSQDRAAILATAASLAAADSHPLAVALRQQGVTTGADICALPGRGISGTVDGQRYVLGSGRLITDAGGTPPETDDIPGASLSYLATANGAVLAAFAFTDTIRPTAKAAVDRLRAQNIGVMLLTGDNAAAANAAGHALGITDIVAAAAPDQKLAAINAKRAAGRTVAMVGDGINDAPALAAANLGIAIGSGAEMAIETADISLLRPDPSLVPDALNLLRLTHAVLLQGLFWAVIYNAIGIPLAAAGMLSPTIAGAAMAASSLCVLANALRLRRWRPA
jgi:Cu+-exporting ATPase